MTVKDLILELQKLDGDLKVFYYDDGWYYEVEEIELDEVIGHHIYGVMLT